MDRRDAARQQRDEETRMTKHIEFVVPRAPVRDADRAPAHGPATKPATEQSSVHGTGPLIPVHEIPGLRPDERVAELRLRVQSGVYARPAVVAQVARAMYGRGTQRQGA
jgi:hypothetical protein